MFKGVNFLAANNAINVDQANITCFELVFERAVKIRAAARKSVYGFNDEQIDLVFRVFAVINGWLHRLLFFRSRLQEYEVLLNGNAA
ncbi:MAG TPA: hypothetical protein VFT16_05905 [Candidatus Saccharimonadales bacterium]|nr:hypothetical protein [Candidatus Saccharimonadales bacterium]